MADFAITVPAIEGVNDMGALICLSFVDNLSRPLVEQLHAAEQGVLLELNEASVKPGGCRRDDRNNALLEEVRFPEKLVVNRSAEALTTAKA